MRQPTEKLGLPIERLRQIAGSYVVGGFLVLVITKKLSISRSLLAISPWPLSTPSSFPSSKKQILVKKENLSNCTVSTPIFPFYRSFYLRKLSLPGLTTRPTNLPIHSSNPRNLVS